MLWRSFLFVPQVSLYKQDPFNIAVSAAGPVSSYHVNKYELCEQCFRINSVIPWIQQQGAIRQQGARVTRCLGMQILDYIPSSSLLRRPPQCSLTQSLPLITSHHHRRRSNNNKRNRRTHNNHRTSGRGVGGSTLRILFMAAINRNGHTQWLSDWTFYLLLTQGALFLGHPWIGK